jgi:hypothetical protein
VVNGNNGGSAGNNSDPLNNGNYGNANGQGGVLYIRYPIATS